MTAVDVPMLDPTAALVDGSGRASSYFIAWCDAVRDRSGGGVDKIEAAHALALAAVPQGTEVVASGGLAAGGALGGNVAVAFYRARDAAASLPATAIGEGDWAYALNGRKPGEGSGAGTGVPVFFSGGAWISACSGAAVTV